MSFIKNLLFGGVKTSEDPTGITGDNFNNGGSNGTDDEPIVEGKFTPRTLSRFNGHDDEKIFIAIRGNVYDCTTGRQFYGPSGPYSNFAGHDASRGLALNSFELEVVPDWDGPMDDLSDLTPQQLESLDEWEQHFKNKYPVVGTLGPEQGVNETVE
ncbi:Damage response protein 1 [Nakaseomyces bracarensis]|uniref:Damage response protein 1 n=1 Tax=Nakaseomyces bracarensis TaxID=273131 RepID=A0ABR4NZJ2_9SACH